ncbi:MAG: hypothetical protein ACK57R_06330 [Dolichospermum sp.]
MSVPVRWFAVPTTLGRNKGTGNREQGTGDREQGTEDREQGTGNGGQGTGVQRKRFFLPTTDN